MNSYSKQESTIVSGIAIIMMLGLHIFFYDSGRPEDVYYNLGYWKSKTIESQISFIGHLCVSIFAFNTGFIIYKFKDNYIKISHNLTRISKLLTGYWIVCVIFIIYGFTVGMELPDNRTFIRNLFGFNLDSTGSFINVCYAWYVHYYIFLLLIAPLIIISMKNSPILMDILIIILFSTALSFLPFKISIIIWPITASLLGFIVSKYGIFSYLRNLFYNKSKIQIFFFSVLIFLTACIFKIYIYQYSSIYPWLRWRPFDGILSFFIILSILISIRYYPKWIINILQLLGTLGLFIWFFQSFFAVGPTAIRKILFLPYFPPLILLWGILLTSIPAYICNFFHTKLIANIFNNSRYYKVKKFN